MARIAVVGNATKDINEAGLLASRRPGGTLLYASMALERLGHDVHPIGYAPLTAYLAMRRAGVPVGDVRLALRPTKFKNRYRDGFREQKARPGPGRALEDPDRLVGHDAVLLGPVLGEVPLGLQLPGDPVTLLDVQGAVRRLGEGDLWGWREVGHAAPGTELPAVDVVRGSMDDLEAWLGTDQAEDAAARLREITGADAVVTDGPGTVWAHDGQLRRAQPDPVDAEDPTGAGDVFDAGLVHALLEGQALGEAIGFSCGLARAFLERPEGVSPSRFPDAQRAAGQAP